MSGDCGWLVRGAGGTGHAPVSEPERGARPASRAPMRSAEERFTAVNGADADRSREQGCSSSRPFPRSGFLLRDRKLGIRVLGEAKNSASPRSPARSTRRQPGSPARSIRSQQGSPDEAEPYQEQATASLTVTELTCGKPGPLNPPELPHEFSTTSQHDNSVHRPYSSTAKNHLLCDMTSTAENHLLCDMISAWHLDQVAHSSSTTADTDPVVRSFSEEQTQHILQKLSGNSVIQTQALHEIELISRISKGEQPCLHKWSGLLPDLINLQKNWNSTWTQHLEEQWLTIILNLAVYKPNREILAEMQQLPDVLKKISDNQHKLGSSGAPLAKVASIVAILSEFDMFKNRLLNNGGIEMLRDLLKVEDIAVRMEAAIAILALYNVDEHRPTADVHQTTDKKMECTMIIDEVLILLDSLPKGPHVLDMICDHAADLVNIIMIEHTGGFLTSRGVSCAISLIESIVRNDVGKMKMVKNLEGFKELLHQLSISMPIENRFQVEAIIHILSERLSSKPKEFAVRWNNANTEISFPLYAEVTFGRLPSKSEWRREWNDVRIIRKLRHLKVKEREMANMEFSDHYKNYVEGKRKPNKVYQIAMNRMNKVANMDRESSEILKLVLCPLCVTHD